MENCLDHWVHFKEPANEPFPSLAHHSGQQKGLRKTHPQSFVLVDIALKIAATVILQVLLSTSGLKKSLVLKLLFTVFDMDSETG